MGRQSRRGRGSAEETAEVVGTSTDAAPDGGPDPSASQAEPDDSAVEEEATGAPESPIASTTYNIGGLPIRSSWRRASVADLETEIRGWSDVERLPEDHGLSRVQLVGYLALLNRMAADGAHPETWPDYSAMSDYSDLEIELDELPEEAEPNRGDTAQPTDEEAS